MKEKEYFELINSYKLQANKSLGQNFLSSSEISKKIVDSLNIISGENVLEIGAGLGSLSYFLAKTPAEITLIDVDDRMICFLNEHYKDDKNIKILRKNVLKTDLSNYDKIIGNLPYYITSSIIEKILLSATNSSTIVLMCQKEVYQKLTKEISPLSLFLNYVARCEKLFDVSRNNFVPIPHVDSLVFKITPNANIKNSNNVSLFKLMNNLFNHRRKTIYNCLGLMLSDKDLALQIIEKTKLNATFRPEQLNIDDYIELEQELFDRKLISRE